MPHQPISFPVGGGLDLVTSSLAIKPGRAIEALNYEPQSSGYARLRGFERYDGHPSPSDATYWRIDFINGDNNGVPPVAGTTIREDGSDVIIGYLVAVVTTGGDWATDTASGYFIATSMTADTTGTTPHFQISPAPFRGFDATAQTLEYDFGATKSRTYLLAAREVVRGVIQKPTGSGPVRGVWAFGGEILAFRDNAGATAGIMYRSTAVGWSVAPVATVIPVIWSSGGATPAGDISTTSMDVGAIDGTIVDVVVVSDDGVDKTGFLIVTGVTGGWTAGGQNVYDYGLSTIFAVTTLPKITTTFPPGGRYRFINKNFYGAANREAMYGVNGVGMAFTYDGLYMNLIPTGMAVDTPMRIAEHKKALVLGFPGGSVQFSVIGEPQAFNPILGASEIGIGNEIADFVMSAGALAILGEKSINVLYGNDPSDYTLETLNDTAGALPNTAQWLGQVVYMDNRGLRSLSTTPSFGNFSFGTMSRMVEPLLTDLRKRGVNPVVTFVSRAKDQYWLFFDDMTGLVMYVGKKDPEIMTFEVPIQVTCGCSVEDDGVERIFVGGEDGYVYEWDKGASFDGAAIEHYVRLPYTNGGSPRLNKNFDSVQVDLEYSAPLTLNVSANLNDGDEDEELPVLPQTLILSKKQGRAELGCEGQNISLKFQGSTSSEEPHTITSVNYFASPRGVER